MWQQIAGMQGLKSLHVRIGKTEGSLHHMNAHDEEMVLSPLYAVTRPSHYRVYVQWYLIDGDQRRLDTPFTNFERGIV